VANSLQNKLGEMLQWLEKLPSWLKTLFFIGGSLLSMFSGRLPENIQNFGLFAGFVLIALAIIGLVLHWSRWKRGGKTVAPFDLIITGLAGMGISFALVIAGFIWQQNYNGQNEKARINIQGLTANIEFGADIRSFQLPQEYVNQLIRDAETRSRQSGKPAVLEGDEATWTYRYMLVNLSQTRNDWKDHITVEFQDSTCIQLERLAPTFLDIREYGSQQIKVDVFRYANYIPGSSVILGWAWLIREGFDHSEFMIESSNLWHQKGIFHVSEVCKIDIVILVDNQPIHKQKLRIDLQDDKSMTLRSLF
jgi:hypothetical protein